MNSALVRTLTFLLLMVIGYWMKGKVPHEQRGGIKQLVLNLALPAVIFVSLQQVTFSWEMAMLPLAAVVFNVLMYFFSAPLLTLAGLKSDSPAFRTIRILIPSLAPGLSCFPFLKEYFGDEQLAMAAFADVGNKIFVLVVLYAVAMRWYTKTSPELTGGDHLKFSKFIKMMINEPVNLAILLALLLVGFNWTYEIFPGFVKEAIDKLAYIMTPLILLYIGLSVKLNWHHTKLISSVLFIRSALAFLLSAILIFLFKIEDHSMIMLAILFPQSSVSFWPFLHIENVRKMEIDKGAVRQTFDVDFAMSTLAMSLPLSTIIILALCTFHVQVHSEYTSLELAFGMLTLGLLPGGIRWVRKIVSSHRFAESKSNS